MLRKLVVVGIAFSLIGGLVNTIFAMPVLEAVVQQQESTVKRLGYVIGVSENSVTILVPVGINTDDSNNIDRNQLVLDELVLNVSEETIIHDMSGNVVDILDIEENTYILVNHSVMQTRSIPPQTHALDIIVNFPMEEGTFTTLEMEGIEFNFTDKTSIFNGFGEKVLREELNEGTKLLLWNSISEDEVTGEITFNELENNNVVINASIAFVLPEVDTNNETVGNVEDEENLVTLENMHGVGIISKVEDTSILVTVPSMLSIDNKLIESELVLHLQEAEIRDVFGNEMSIEDLKEEDMIRFLHVPRMALSMPPQTSAIEVIVGYPDGLITLVTLSEKVESDADSVVFELYDLDERLIFNNESDLFLNSTRFNLDSLNRGQNILIVPKYEIDSTTQEIVLVKTDNGEVIVDLAFSLPVPLNEDSPEVQPEPENYIDEAPTDIIEERTKNIIEVLGTNIVVHGTPIEAQAVNNSDGVMLLPVRDIAEAFGFNVHWNDTERLVTLTKGENFDERGPVYEHIWLVLELEEIAVFEPEGNQITALGEAQTLTTSLEIINDITYAPVEFFGFVFEAIVQ